VSHFPLSRGEGHAVAGNATSRGGGLASSDQLFLTLHPRADLNRGAKPGDVTPRTGGSQGEPVASTTLSTSRRPWRPSPRFGWGPRPGAG